MCSKERDENLKNQYLNKIKPYLEYQKVAYKIVEDIYKRFWGYFEMKREDLNLFIIYY